MELHLFGAATPTGEVFRQQAADEHLLWPLHPYFCGSADYPADFTNPAAFWTAGAPALWISCCPIWLFSLFPVLPLA